MSKLNKIITNQPIVLTEEEVNNLSETLSAVRTAGGGEGGHLYTGDNKYIGVDNGNYKIKFLDNAAAKLESISSKLDKTEAATTYQTKTDMSAYLTTAIANSDYAKKTEIPDSITDFSDTDTVIYSYLYPLTADIQQQINGKQNKLQFDLNAKGEISAIGTLNNTTTAIAGANGITGDYYSASNPSGFINSTQAETQILEKHYLTEASGDLYYLPIPSELIEGTQYAYTTQGWSPIQGGGGASGISFVNHDDTLIGDGNTVKLGVDTTKIQTKLTEAEIQNIIDVTTLKTASAGWDAKVDQSDLNDYLTKTQYGTDSATFALKTQLDEYATKGYADNASANALSEAETWVENKHYLTSVPDTYALKTDIPTTVAQLTDSGNYYKTTETSSKNELSTEFAKYQPTGNYLVEDDITGKLDKSIYANASGNWEASYNVLTAYSAAGTWLTEHQSLTNYYTKDQTSGATQLSTEFVKYLTTAKYNTDSATFALKSDLNGLVNSASVTTNDNYVMTNTGWKVLTLPGGGMTQVYHDTTLTGDGNANDNQLGVKWETLSSNTIAYSNSAFNLTNGTSVSSFNQISAAIDDRYSKSSSDGRYLQKSLDDTLTGNGTDNKKLGVAWSALSGNKIDSAKSANSAEGLTNGTAYSGFDDISAAFGNLSSYLPTSGGTVSGQLVVSGGSNFDTENLKFIRTGQNGYGRIGLASDGALALKVDNGSGDTLQINMSTEGSTGYGNINVNNHGNQSKVVNVPTASYNSMSSFDNTNGPNYMLRKTASGFDIGAAVINVTTLPAQTEANTYYFIYDT